MNIDKYPIKYLLMRLSDLAWFILALVLLVLSGFFGILASEPGSKLIISLGMAITLIGVLVDYRQKAYYEKDSLEAAILSNGFQAKYLNSVAKLRHTLISYNALIVVSGILVSGYGTVWG